MMFKLFFNIVYQLRLQLRIETGTPLTCSFPFTRYHENELFGKVQFIPNNIEEQAKWNRASLPEL